MQGVVAAILAAFALGSLDTPPAAIAAALCSILLAASAITGRCFVDLGAPRSAEPEQNLLGYQDARDHHSS